MKKKKFTIITLFLSLFLIMPSSTLADTPNSPNIITQLDSSNPKADIINYQYKEVNGVFYRRLYNFTKQIPLSDWEIIK